MTEVDALVIGAGPAGLAAAVSLKKNNIKRVLIIERECFAGGVLLQCIHNGFGIHKFKKELTGPEYAERYIKLAKKQKVEIMCNTAVLDISHKDPDIEIMLLSEERGLLKVAAKAVILAMGCREKNRGNINIPGSRPAGIMTAGFAQRLVNIEGYIPGSEVVILGSGDIGLIMARRFSLEGVRVKGVIEIQSFAGGLTRNIVQCLNDFHIPLYLSHTITKIIGNKRLEAVAVAPIDSHNEPNEQERFILNCDTLLLSIGLIPENELSLKAGIELDPVTRGPLIDSDFMCSVPGIFACGNVLHVHDIVDYVSEEAEYVGEKAAHYITDEFSKGTEVPIKSGNLVRYILPSVAEKGKPCTLCLRPIVPAENIWLLLKEKKDIIFKKKYKKIMPSNMIRFKVRNIPEHCKTLEMCFQQDLP